MFSGINKGCTHGDVTAVALYALEIRSLINNLKEAVKNLGVAVNHERSKQAW